MKITSIPAILEAEYGGKMNAMSRGTGISELTIAKYRFDVNNEKHVILNGKLMVHHKTSKPIE